MTLLYENIFKERLYLLDKKYYLCKDFNKKPISLLNLSQKWEIL
jgi:hypothetical protein